MGHSNRNMKASGEGNVNCGVPIQQVPRKEILSAVLEFILVILGLLPLFLKIYLKLN